LSVGVELDAEHANAAKVLPGASRDQQSLEETTSPREAAEAMTIASIRLRAACPVGYCLSPAGDRAAHHRRPARCTLALHAAPRPAHCILAPAAQSRRRLRPPEQSSNLYCLSAVGASFPLSLVALAACLAIAGCAGPTGGAPDAKQDTTPETSTPGGAGGVESGANEGGASDQAVGLDLSDCAERPLSDCESVETKYESNVGFERTPAFAECAMYNSFDGCGVLEFAFDADGCAASVAPGPSGWQNTVHLAPLQSCLTDVLQSARFPCLSGGTLEYRESCFVH
jgi:hypothetical protein